MSCLLCYTSSLVASCTINFLKEKRKKLKKCRGKWYKMYSPHPSPSHFLEETCNHTCHSSKQWPSFFKIQSLPEAEHGGKGLTWGRNKHKPILAATMDKTLAHIQWHTFFNYPWQNTGSKQFLIERGRHCKSLCHYHDLCRCCLVPSKVLYWWWQQHTRLLDHKLHYVQFQWAGWAEGGVPGGRKRLLLLYSGNDYENGWWGE